MENNNCGCEDTKIDKTVKDNSNTDSSCGCEELPNQPVEDSDCGCGGDSADESENVTCCGATEYPDDSLIFNPAEPQFIAHDDFLEEFENYARSIGINSIGYAQMTPELLIKDKFIQYPNTIVLNMEMSQKIIETEPGAEAKKLNDAAYAHLADMTYKLSDYLREHGFATEVSHPMGGIVNFSALGQKAGLGYIGQSGLLISPELGPRQKISAIFVSIANLPKSAIDHSWIPDYCDKCGKCVKACPEKALIENETCCGTKEIELIQKNCIGCSQGCTYCIEDCPFTDRGYDHVKDKFDKMTAKLQKRKNSQIKRE
jgi:epoxyqueuosine reductase